MSSSLPQGAVDHWAEGVREPWEESDEFGTVVLATVKTVNHQEITKVNSNTSFLFLFQATKKVTLTHPFSPSFLSREDTLQW